MEPNHLRWVQQPDLITASGEASATNGTPPPTDDELWANAHVRRDLHLPAVHRRGNPRQRRRCVVLGPAGPGRRSRAATMIEHGLPSRAVRARRLREGGAAR